LTGSRPPNSDFNVDLGCSNSEEQARESVAPMLERLPPIAAGNASDSGTDVVRYLSESQGFSAFVSDDGAICHACLAGTRAIELRMGHYPILDRAPKGRDEADGPSSGSPAATTTTRARRHQPLGGARHRLHDHVGDRAIRLHGARDQMRRSCVACPDCLLRSTS
jgi:predicted dithiol-disulfide oxidoreductase (DUF899 family)